MTAYLGQTLTRTMLGQLCAALWDSQSRPVVIQAGIEPGYKIMPLALRCSALDRCATQEQSDASGIKNISRHSQSHYRRCERILWPATAQWNSPLSRITDNFMLAFQTSFNGGYSTAADGLKVSCCVVLCDLTSVFRRKLRRNPG